MKKAKQRQLLKLLTLLLIFVGLWSYFYNYTSRTSFVGISLAKTNKTWQIRSIKNASAASQSQLKVGTRLLKVDQNNPAKLTGVEQLLLVKKAKTLVIEENHKVERIRLKKVSVTKAYYLLSVVSLFIIVGIIFLLQNSSGQQVEQNYFRLLSLLALGLVALVPSSLGNYLGRLVIISFISLLPVYLEKLLRVKGGSGRWTDCLKLWAIVNIGGYLLGLMVKLPYGWYYYINVGLFYLFLLVVAVMLGFYGVMKASYWKTQVNFSLLFLLALLPLYVFYILPRQTQISFELLVLFLLIPLLALVHILILNRLLKNSYQHNRLAYLSLTLFIAFSLILLARLVELTPLYFSLPYSVLLIATLLPLIAEATQIINRNQKNNSTLAIFIATEEEREQLATQIHDTVIQDAIFMKRKLEEESELSKQEVILSYEELIYDLREVCAHIYPLQINSFGMKVALGQLFKKLEQNYPLVINAKYDSSLENLTLEMKNFIFRSIQELITNSYKHGQATIIRFDVKQIHNTLQITVTDNGRFKEPLLIEEGHLGLNLIRDKLDLFGGKLSIMTTDETKVTMIIPLTRGVIA